MGSYGLRSYKISPSVGSFRRHPLLPEVGSFRRLLALAPSLGSFCRPLPPGVAGSGGKWREVAGSGGTSGGYGGTWQVRVAGTAVRGRYGGGFWREVARSGGTHESE